MANNCTWDPSKHGGKPCPIHSGGMWDENILTKKDKIEKLKEKGYSEEEIEEELKSVGFDDDFDFEDEIETSAVENGYNEYVKTDEDKKIWESLSDDDKYLLGASLDLGFENEIEDFEKEEIMEKLDQLKNKFSQNQQEQKPAPTNDDEGYKKADTLDVSLKNQLLNGEITLNEASNELNKAGWYNFKPSREETLKRLGLGNDFKDVPLKKRLSREEFDDLVKKDFSTLSEEDKDALIRAIRGTYKLESKGELPF